MTATKKQELEALEKILKIVKDLGPDSYLKMTFNGCFEQAKENIENDWGSNYKDMYESAKNGWNMTKGELEGVKIQLESAKLKNLELDRIKEQLEGIANAKAQACDELRASKEEVASLKSEIMELKAKLYGMMTERN